MVMPAQAPIKNPIPALSAYWRQGDGGCIKNSCLFRLFKWHFRVYSGSPNGISVFIQVPPMAFPCLFRFPQWHFRVYSGSHGIPKHFGKPIAMFGKSLKFFDDEQAIESKR
jgi:hypothetical protein